MGGKRSLEPTEGRGRSKISPPARGQQTPNAEELRFLLHGKAVSLERNHEGVHEFDEDEDLRRTPQKLRNEVDNSATAGVDQSAVDGVVVDLDVDGENEDLLGLLEAEVVEDQASRNSQGRSRRLNTMASTLSNKEEEARAQNEGAVDAVTFDPETGPQHNSDVEVTDEQLWDGWMWRVFCISVVGWWVNCQPSEPYLTKYMEEVKGLTDDEINLRVWPTNTACMLAFYIPAGLLAERIGYWRVILLGLCFREATRMLLIWGQGINNMIAMQVTYSGAMACTTALYTSVLLVVPKARAAHASACVYFMYHFGNVIGSAVGEGVYTATENLTLLFYISWACTSVGTIWFFVMFPKLPPKKPISFRSFFQNFSGRSCLDKVENGTSQLVSFSDPVKIWAVAAVFSFGATVIWGNYYQMAFYVIDEAAKFGILEMCLEACNALGSVTPLLIAWHSGEHLLYKYAAPLSILFTVLMGGMEVATVETHIIQPLYAYAVVRSLAASGLEVSLQTAVGLDPNTSHYALIITVVQMLSLSICTALQLGVGVALDFGSDEFLISGAVLNGLAIFGVVVTYTVLYFMHRNKQQDLDGFDRRTESL